MLGRDEKKFFAARLHWPTFGSGIVWVFFIKEIFPQSFARVVYL